MSSDKAYRALHFKYCALERELAAANAKLVELTVQVDALEKEAQILTDDIYNIKKNAKRYRSLCGSDASWIELTNNERNVITDKVIGFNSCVGWEDDYAKAIEAKLKEKNGG